MSPWAGEHPLVHGCGDSPVAPGGGDNSAQAATIPRLSGTHQVKATYLVQTGDPSQVRTSVIRTWKFKPKCTGTKGCKTTFKRERGVPPLHVTYTLRPVKVGGAWHYRGTTTYLEGCISRADGSVLDPKGYSTHETMDITVLKRNAHNVVTSFKAHYVLKLTRTASAPKPATPPKSRSSRPSPPPEGFRPLDSGMSGHIAGRG